MVPCKYYNAAPYYCVTGCRGVFRRRERYQDLKLPIGPMYSLLLFLRNAYLSHCG
ncbi:rCG63253 [Rattus norvegicus]|uniref:RCG63253 n=1 Tax=Rattus norvegicus TaxID=10116 RepID=A6JHT0_RAT|nr:rCG63253 [Rattus norvegicus]